MSLLTDIIFVKALRSNEELMSMLPAGDVHNTSIALPDIDLDNAELPYIIVTFDGLQNEDATKDCSFEGETDRVQIGVEIAAKTRGKLGELAVLCRQTIRAYFEDVTSDVEDYNLVPNDYTFTAQAVQYDPDKPCYWQTLNFSCDTNLDTDEQN